MRTRWSPGSLACMCMCAVCTHVCMRPAVRTRCGLQARSPVKERDMCVLDAGDERYPVLSYPILSYPILTSSLTRATDGKS